MKNKKKNRKLSQKEMESEINSRISEHLKDRKFYQAGFFDFMKWLNFPITDVEETTNIIAGFPHRNIGSKYPTISEAYEIEDWIYREIDAGNIEYKKFPQEILDENNRLVKVDIYKFKPQEITKHFIDKGVFSLHKELIKAYDVSVSDAKKLNNNPALGAKAQKQSKALKDFIKKLEELNILLDLKLDFQKFPPRKDKFIDVLKEYSQPVFSHITNDSINSHYLKKCNIIKFSKNATKDVIAKRDELFTKCLAQCSNQPNPS